MIRIDVSNRKLQYPENVIGELAECSETPSEATATSCQYWLK